MTRPKAYDPQPGYKYQILCRNQSFDQAWDHLDYAVDHKDKKHLVDNYRLAYGFGWSFKSIKLPTKYWPNTIAREKKRLHRLTPAHPHGLCEKANRCVEHDNDPSIPACSWSAKH